MYGNEGSKGTDAAIETLAIAPLHARHDAEHEKSHKQVWLHQPPNSCTAVDGTNASAIEGNDHGFPLNAHRRVTTNVTVGAAHGREFGASDLVANPPCHK